MLAVILILGIISLIAIPVVSNIIAESKKNALKNSAKNIISTTEDYVSKKYMSNNPVLNDTFYFPDDGNLELGKNPSNGYISVMDGDKYSIAISDGNYCAFKDYNSDNVEVVKLEDGDVCDTNILKKNLGKTYFKLYYTKNNTINTEFRSDTYREKIVNIDFTYDETVPSEAVVSWDLSNAKDNSIKGWLVTNKENSSFYDLHISSNKNIYANAESSGLFSDFTNLKRINFDNFNTSDSIYMTGMFIRCSSLTSLNIYNWDTSKVESMYAIFYMCNNLTSLNVSKWNTSKVKNTSLMFYGCSKLESLDLSKWNTSNNKYMYSMFQDCTNLRTLNISKFDISNITDIDELFDGCSSLTSLDLSSFDTSKVTTMIDTFNSCSKLEQVNISNKWTKSFTGIGLSSTTKIYNVDTGSYVVAN